MQLEVAASGLELYTAQLGRTQHVGSGRRGRIKADLVGRGTVALQALKGQKMSDRTGWSHRRLMTLNMA